MFDFIAYTPPSSLDNTFDTAFAIVEKDNKYFIYLNEDPYRAHFLYEKDNKEPLQHKEIKSDNNIYPTIICAFQTSKYNNKYKLHRLITGDGAFYSYNGEELEEIEPNICLKNLRNYAGRLRSGRMGK